MTEETRRFVFAGEGISSGGDVRERPSCVSEFSLPQGDQSMPIVIECAPNGGWIVRQMTGPGYQPETLGAFGSASEMIEALSLVLVRDH